MCTPSGHFRAVILGTAVGDAIGLPREGLSRRRAGLLFGGAPLKHGLIFGRGMVSDDSEHTFMAAEALLASGGDPRRFARSLAWRLRWWILALPAGVGMATAKACIKLWLGFPPSRSGVWSAGNGPAMRAAILGAYAWQDLPRLCELVRASTRLTHTDPKAEAGALAVALAAAFAVQRVRTHCDINVHAYMEFVRPFLAGTQVLDLIEQVARQVEAGASLESYLESIGQSRGISGYINHTVPACLFCWLTWPSDFRTAIEQIVIAGGDADSTGAIVGGLTATSAGVDAIPAEWLDGIFEWPLNIAWMEGLARSLEEESAGTNRSTRRLVLLWPAVLVRNVFFLCVVVAHGLRRLLPPY
jgi:ADP-ribosylglycohydrolase